MARKRINQAMAAIRKLLICKLGFIAFNRGCCGESLSASGSECFTVQDREGFSSGHGPPAMSLWEPHTVYLSCALYSQSCAYDVAERRLSRASQAESLPPGHCALH